MHGGSCAGCVSRLSASKPIFNFLNHSSSSELTFASYHPQLFVAMGDVVECGE